MKAFFQFLSKRIELMLFMLAIGLLFLSQAVSAIFDPEYVSFGVSWIENLVYDHVKALNVLVGVWIIIRLVFNRSYRFLSETLETIIGGDEDMMYPGVPRKREVTLWQRALLSLGLFFLLVLVYVMT